MPVFHQPPPDDCDCDGDYKAAYVYVYLPDGSVIKYPVIQGPCKWSVNLNHVEWRGEY